MNTVYFLCTGNSCRSQIAEGFEKRYLPDWNIQSAGTEAHGLNPIAVKVMAEVGIDISHQTSDIIDQDILNNATLVVTLCGDAADKCPVTPLHVKREHWGVTILQKPVEQKKTNGLYFKQFVMQLKHE